MRDGENAAADTRPLSAQLFLLAARVARQDWRVDGMGPVRGDDRGSEKVMSPSREAGLVVRVPTNGLADAKPGSMSDGTASTRWRFLRTRTIFEAAPASCAPTYHSSAVCVRCCRRVCWLLICHRDVAVRFREQRGGLREASEHVRWTAQS